MARISQTHTLVNTKLIFQFFERVNKLNLDGLAAEHLKASLDQLESTESLNSFLK
jgi:hypothetical protein